MTKFYDVPEVAELLSLGRQQVYELIWAEELAWVDMRARGKRPRIRISHEEVERFIKSRSTAARRNPSKRTAAA